MKLVFLSLLLAAAAYGQNVNGQYTVIGSTAQLPATCAPTQTWLLTPAGTIYTCQNGVPAVATGGGGGSLPTATAAGQVPVSTAAGTTYTAQMLTVTIEHVFSAAGTYNYTHNLGTSTPLYTCYVNSGATPSAVVPVSSSAVAVTVAGASDTTCAFGYAPAAVAQPPFTITVPTINSFQSSAVIVSVSVAPAGGFTGTVALTASGLPTGVTASFSPASVTLGSTQTSNLTLTMGNSATTGTTTYTVTGTSGTNTSSATPSLTINTGPQQQWYMNEGASPFLDTSGHTNNLVGTGLTFTTVSGIPGTVATFSGSSSGIAATNNTYTNFSASQAFSISEWFVNTSFANQNCIATNMNTSGTLTGYSLCTYPGSGSGGIIFFFMGQGCYGSPNYCIQKYFYATSTGSTYLSTNTLYHVVVTVSGSGTAAGVTAYINGIQVAVDSTTSDTLSGAVMTNSNPVYAGGSGQLGVGFAGNIADLRIFNYALTSTEVQLLYSAGAK